LKANGGEGISCLRIHKAAESSLTHLNQSPKPRTSLDHNSGISSMEYEKPENGGGRSGVIVKGPRLYLLQRKEEQLAKKKNL